MAREYGTKIAKEYSPALDFACAWEYNKYKYRKPYMRFIP